MKRLIKSMAVLISFTFFGSVADESNAVMLPSNLLSKGNLKAVYEGAASSAFKASNDNARHVYKLNSDGNDTSHHLLSSTPLTGKLMVQLQNNVDVDAFLFDFDVELEWQNNSQLLLVIVPDETSVEDLFVLRDSMNSSDDVKWVEVDKTSKNNTID